MTIKDRAAVLADLAGYRVTLAGLKRDYIFYQRIADEWMRKALAAEVVGDEDYAEECHAFHALMTKESKESFDAHALLLKVVRTLEMELTR